MHCYSGYPNRDDEQLTSNIFIEADRMNVIEAIYRRRSIRGFKSDPVSKEILARVLEAACRAPSAVNSQPWEFIVLTGDILNKIKDAMVDKVRNREKTNPEHDSIGWSGECIFRNRQIELAKELFKRMDIARDDKKKRALWLERGFRFFEAPVAIIILTDKSLSDSGPLLDLGATMQTLCLAALHHGLGTCIADQGVSYPDVLRNIACIPDKKKIIISVAIGYPDASFPANHAEIPRETLDKNTHWLGF